MMFLYLIEDVCQEPAILKVIWYIENVINVAFFIVPMVLIVMISVDLFKNVISKEDDMQKNIVILRNRLLYCVAMFFVPTIISVLLNIVEDSIGDLNVNYSSCISNIENIDYYEKLAKEKKKKAEEEEKRKLALNNANKNVTDSLKKYTIISNGQTDSDAIIMGQKYDLTDSQLRGLASICAREQGSVKGAKAEASLMANRFELYGSKYGKDGSGLYKYVAGCEWWGKSAGSYMSSHASSVNNKYVSAVKEVFVLGKRTLSLAVDEHDCWDCNSGDICSGGFKGDICSLTTDGKKKASLSYIKNRSNYKQDKTVVKNVYGATYTFYSFPESNSDPFGYTPTAKKKVDKLNNG